tara:strand:- start:1140 stop:1415 length:276 start_codon:yes stop_codon:yes gene_type:complete
VARVFAQEALKQCQAQGVDDRYEMILLAVHRAKQLSRGAVPITGHEVERGQADSVNALRDFETGQYNFEELREDLIKSMQKVSLPSAEDEE